MTGFVLIGFLSVIGRELFWVPARQDDNGLGAGFLQTLFSTIFKISGTENAWFEMKRIK